MHVEEYIKNCGECVTHKTPIQRAAPLHHIVSHGPMDLVCMDFLSMEPDSKGISNVLVVTDHFTRYAQAFPTKKPEGPCCGKGPDGEIFRTLWTAFEDPFGSRKRFREPSDPRAVDLDGDTQVADNAVSSARRPAARKVQQNYALHARYVKPGEEAYVEPTCALLGPRVQQHKV